MENEKETLVSIVESLTVGDYCHIGESTITRTVDGWDVEDNGEGVSVDTAKRAVEIAVENES